jgi:hypothetical protein
MTNGRIHPELMMVEASATRRPSFGFGLKWAHSRHDSVTFHSQLIDSTRTATDMVSDAQMKWPDPGIHLGQRPRVDVPHTWPRTKGFSDGWE